MLPGSRNCKTTEGELQVHSDALILGLVTAPSHLAQSCRETSEEPYINRMTLKLIPLKDRNNNFHVCVWDEFFNSSVPFWNAEQSGSPHPFSVVAWKRPHVARGLGCAVRACATGSPRGLCRQCVRALNRVLRAGRNECVSKKVHVG